MGVYMLYLRNKYEDQERRFAENYLSLHFSSCWNFEDDFPDTNTAFLWHP